MSNVTAPFAHPHAVILCKIVDNFGDAGVCARLTRQLATEKGFTVDLYTDQPPLVQRLLGQLPAAFSDQVQIKPWSDDDRHWHALGLQLPERSLLIEAFACGTPPALLGGIKERMVQTQTTQPVWINLEYLSAEPWAEDAHKMISRHPSTGLVQIFYFMGFSERTGGLLREQDACPQNTDMLDDTALWAMLNVPAKRQAGELRLSLFCYADRAPLEDLWDGLAALSRPIRLFYPEGLIIPPAPAAAPWLNAHPFPFLTQRDYDRLLRACDFNFVRGEDSFVRAQWAKKPFLWHIYPQTENAHFVKLEAFLARQSAFFDKKDAETLALLHKVWNLSAGGNRDLWGSVMNNLPTLTRAAARWADNLTAQTDLASHLAVLVQNKGNKQ